MDLKTTVRALRRSIKLFWDWRSAFRGYQFGKEALAAIDVVKNHSQLDAINLLTLFEQAIYCERQEIEGAFVECGVWKGGAVGIMALANLKYGSLRRSLHLFDAFDDICPPDPVIDGPRAVEDVRRYSGMTPSQYDPGQLRPIQGIYKTLGGHGTIEICRELLQCKIGYPGEYLHFHKGWFQDTLPMDAKQIGKIAILRLDGDWYASTKVCLEHLFDKVVSGGVVIIDDYGHYDGCAKAVDEFLKKIPLRTFLSYSNPNCRYFIKP
jgi:hypothetical protein